MNTTYDQHLAAASRNFGKPATALQAGDYVTAYGCWIKFDHGDLVEQLRMTDESGRELLCRITRVEEVADGALLDRKALAGWKPQGNEGGSQSDDDLDGVIDPSTYYTLAVLVREKSSGRAALIDPEGYDWPRYVLFLPDYKGPFAPLSKIGEAEQALAAARDALDAAESDLRNEKRDAELIARYGALPCRRSVAGHEPCGAEIGRNIRAALKIEFPGVKFAVKQSRVYDYRVEYANGPSREAVAAVVARFRNLGAGCAFTAEFGHADVAVERDVAEAVEKSALDHYELFGATDAERLRRVRAILARTDIPEGKIVTGFEWNGEATQYVPVFAAA